MGGGEAPQAKLIHEGHLGRRVQHSFYAWGDRRQFPAYFYKKIQTIFFFVFFTFLILFGQEPTRQPFLR